VGLTLIQLADRVRTEADAYRELERMRWGNQPICCHCDSTNVRYLRPENGVSRRTSSGSMSERRVWQCRDCRKQFSATTGTVMHGSKVSIRMWLFCIFEMCASKNGVAAREIERKYGVCPRTAWHLMHRIREAMKADVVFQAMRGEVVADETWIGGKDSNRHQKDRTFAPASEGPRRVVPGERQDPKGDKAVVLSLIDKRTGEARSRVVLDVTGKTLRKVMADHIDMANTVLYTDDSSSYNWAKDEFLAHHTVNHSQDEYVRYEGEHVITSNQAENFFSQLKRSLDGTHHHVSRDHLDRYLAEFDFRYSSRESTDEARMAKLVGQVAGKRLTYKLVSV
jgi:transposase-like protein